MPRPRRTARPSEYRFPESERLNNPTAETALLMSPEEMEDQPIPEAEAQDQVRHPRLQWNRESHTDYSRTYGPLYTHDKVSPSEFINSLLKQQEQGDMFAAFNGLPEDANYQPYEYNGHWNNRLIRATAQRAMASLLYKDAMRGKVDLIYIDPPYNISFRSNFQANAQEPESAEDWDSVPDDPVTIKAFRDNYRNNVHSYLDGLHEQFALGRELLNETGSFILQIGPDNVHEAVLLMSEVFGRENHVATIPFRTNTNQSTRLLPEVGNWLVWFGKNKAETKYNQLYEPMPRKEAIAHMSSYAMGELPDGTTRNLTSKEKEDPGLLPEGSRIFQSMGLLSSNTSTTGRSDPLEWHGKTYHCPPGNHWRVSRQGIDTLGKANRLVTTPNGGLRWRKYDDEFPGKYITAVWENTAPPQVKQYVVETPPKVLERCILMTTDPGDIVLDLTCGSGAMPFQAETWGRRWIAVDVSQVSIAIARERLITNTYPYHLLKDSSKGDKLDHELEQPVLPEDKQGTFNPKTSYGQDPAKGFVTDRQLRVSAAILAYGYDDEEPIRHPDRTRKDNTRIRVASGFTVESDSPYRSIRPGEENGYHDGEDVTTLLQTSGFVQNGDLAPDPVTQRITASLGTSGINQPGLGRYKVENLTPSEIRDITHTGMLVAPDGVRHNACFYIGREDEVISNVQTRNAATAIRTAEPDCTHLVMVGFGRDGDAHTISRYMGNLTILQVAANKDLQLPHLKEETGDNAFTIVSEPEVRLHQKEDGQIQLEVVGINAFNPSRGIIEPRSARTIMGILVDTRYDTESFRARLINVKQVRRNQATLKNLKAAFNRDIDSEKWGQMLSNTTIPFDLPEEGVKIAVKVIDQYGVEHMTVIDEPRKMLDGRNPTDTSPPR